MSEIICSVCQTAMKRQDEPSAGDLRQPAVFTIKDARRVYPKGEVTTLDLIAHVCPRCGLTLFFEYKTHLAFQSQGQSHSSSDQDS